MGGGQKSCREGSGQALDNFKILLPLGPASFEFLCMPVTNQILERIGGPMPCFPGNLFNLN